MTDVQVLARDEETGARKKTLIKRFGMVELVEALVDVYPQSLAKIDEHIKESKYVVLHLFSLYYYATFY
jgi:hypothetical protein